MLFLLFFALGVDEVALVEALSPSTFLLFFVFVLVVDDGVDDAFVVDVGVLSESSTTFLDFFFFFFSTVVGVDEEFSVVVCKRKYKENS